MAESGLNLMKQLKKKSDFSLKIIGNFFNYFLISLCCIKIHYSLFFSIKKRLRDEKIAYSDKRVNVDFCIAGEFWESFCSDICKNSKFIHIWQANYIWVTKIHIYALFAHKSSITCFKTSVALQLL